MRKSKTLISSAIAFAIVVGAFVSPVAVAASQDECSIWLCLPTGFPSGCSAAKKAFVKRVKKGKSPLPDFSSCAAKDDGASKLTYKEGYAAAFGFKNVCSEYNDKSECVSWNSVPQNVQEGTKCRMSSSGHWKPRGCTPVKSVDVYVDGIPTGDTFYWN
ncbi:MAG: hypothetical protein ACRC9N_11205 [Aeromonas sp.]